MLAVTYARTNSMGKMERHVDWSRILYAALVNSDATMRAKSEALPEVEGELVRCKLPTTCRHHL